LRIDQELTKVTDMARAGAPSGLGWGNPSPNGVGFPQKS